MNTVLKRKLSSIIASESIAKNIGKRNNKNFCNTATSHNKKNHINVDNLDNLDNLDKLDKEEPANKRHKKMPNKEILNKSKPNKAKPNKTKPNKKTHYNENMEPIRLFQTGTNSVSGTGVIESSCLPKRIREVVWNTYNGETYSSKCYVPWCNNIINVFNYQVGHDIPESKGGTYDIGNLRPICSNCNLSMGNKWTIQEWGKLVNRNDKSKCQDGDVCVSKTKTNETISISNQTVNTDDTLLDCNKDTTNNITFYTLLVLVVSYMIM
jgi:hypothetical protein